MRLFSYIFGVLLIIPLFGTTIENSSINCIKSDKDIFAIYKLDNKTMAIGGDFTQVNLKKRSKIALIEPNSCKLLDKFSNFKIENKSNPSNSFIRAIERYKDYLIIGGVFSSIDDGDGIQKCDGLAIIDLKSQKLFWCYEGIDIKNSHGVFSLAVDRKNKILYVGGDFREPKRALLAFDISSLDKDESNIVYLDAPVIDGDIYSMKEDTSSKVIYISGSFRKFFGKIEDREFKSIDLSLNKNIYDFAIFPSKSIYLQSGDNRILKVDLLSFKSKRSFIMDGNITFIDKKFLTAKMNFLDSTNIIIGAKGLSEINNQKIYEVASLNGSKVNWSPKEFNLDDPIRSILSDNRYLYISTSKRSLVKYKLKDNNYPKITIEGTKESECSLPQKSKDFIFRVKLSKSSKEGVEVYYQTKDLSAKVSDRDYIYQEGVLYFKKNETQKEINIKVRCDNKVERDEEFKVVLKMAKGGVIEKSEAIATILNDDEFANRPLDTTNTCIEGNVWLDRNRDGIWQKDCNSSYDLSSINGLIATVSKLCDANSSYDATKDSCEDIYHAPIEGVKVSLLDINGSDINKSTISAPDGSYRICDLSPGSYIVNIDLPNGYEVTKKDEGSDDSIDNDIDPTTKKSDPILLSDGTQEVVDIGLFVENGGSIGDFAWYDKDKDGVQDNEDGICGVVVYLVKDGKDTQRASITDKNGKYLLDNLPDGNYSIKVAKPRVYNFGPPQMRNDAIDSDIIREEMGGDGIVYGYSREVSISGGEEFLNLDAGFVCGSCEAVINVEKYTNGYDADDPNGSDVPYVYVGDKVTWEYNVTNTGDANLTNIKLVDNIEGEISCPKDRLSSKESMICKLVGEAKKDGLYENEANVTAVNENNSSQIVSDTDLSHYYGLNPKIDIEKYTNNSDADEINGSDVVRIKIGDKVEWKYVIKNIGNVKLININVEDNREGEIDCPKDILDVNESMECLKEGIAQKGDYENIATVTATDENNRSVSDVDKSHYIGIKGVCLGDFIWEDSNGNGVQDLNESGIEGVKIELFDKDGNRAKDIFGNDVNETYTDSNGKYRFCNLGAGEYFIKITPPDGYYPTKMNATDDERVDSDINQSSYKSEIVELDGTKDYLDLDGGLYRPGCIGDYIWLDSNLNGIQDSDEKGIKDIKIELLDSNHQVAKDINGSWIDPQYSDENGNYKFCNLAPGVYEIKVTPPNKDYFFTKMDATDDSMDSDIDQYGFSHQVLLKSNEEYLDLDGGLILLASLGDYYWYDENLNGIQDPNEPGVVGIKVELLNKNKELIATTYTNKEGKYKFEKLIPGFGYILRFSLPDTYLFTLPNRGDDNRDSDVDKDGYTKIIYLEAGENNLSYDAGIYCSCDDYLLHPDKIENTLNSISIFTFILFGVSLLLLGRKDS